MKMLGLAALALSGLIVGALLHRTSSYGDTGTVHAEGQWWVAGVKGEGGWALLPEEVADIPRVGDSVRSTSVWSRDLRLSYEKYEFSRDGAYLGKGRVGTARFFLVVCSIASGPLLIWAVVAISVSLVRARR